MIEKTKRIIVEIIQIPTVISRKMTVLYHTYSREPLHPSPGTSRPGTSRYAAHNNAGSRAEFAVAGNWRSGWRRICTQRCGIRKVGIISNNYRALWVNYVAGVVNLWPAIFRRVCVRSRFRRVNWVGHFKRNRWWRCCIVATVLCSINGCAKFVEWKKTVILNMIMFSFRYDVIRIVENHISGLWKLYIKIWNNFLKTCDLIKS